MSEVLFDSSEIYCLSISLISVFCKDKVGNFILVNEESRDFLCLNDWNFRATGIIRGREERGGVCGGWISDGSGMWIILGLIAKATGRGVKGGLIEWLGVFAGTGKFTDVEIPGRVESSVGETVDSVSKTGIFVVNSNGGAEGVVEISEELEESRITSVSEKKLFVTGFNGWNL